MNENYNPINEEGKSISITGLFRYILKRWKVLLVAGLIAAVALGGLAYMDSNKKYKAALKQTGAQQQPGVSISDYEKKVVLAKMDLIQSNEKIVSEYEYYYANSIKVRLDPNHVYEGTARYVINQAEDSEAVKAYGLFEGDLFTQEVYEELAGMLSEPTDVSMLKEVIQYTMLKEAQMYVQSNYDQYTMLTEAQMYVPSNYELKIIVRHFNEEDCETMLKFVEEKMKDLPQIMEKEQINASVSFVSSNVGIVVDRSLAPLKKDLQTAKMTAYETISNTKNNMSDSQKAYYEYLLKQENGGTTGTTAPKAEKPKVDLMMIVIGGVAGVMLAAVAYVAMYLFGGRVHNKEELKSWLSIPVVGFEGGAEMIAANLEAIASKYQLSKLCFTGTHEKQNSELMMQIKTLLDKKGIQVTVTNSILNHAKALAEASGCGSVVLMEKCDVSKEKDIRETLAKASSCGIQVLGIVLEK